MACRKYRKGVFIVVYIKKPVRYLLLHRKLHWKGWEFPKGGLLANEKYKHAVTREIKEETGLKILKMRKFDIKGKFIYDKKTEKERKFKGFDWKLFAVEVKKDKVRISRKEHDNYKWASYSQAVKLLKWPNQKKCIKIVNNSLKRFKNASKHK